MDPSRVTAEPERPNARVQETTTNSTPWFRPPRRRRPSERLVEEVLDPARDRHPNEPALTPAGAPEGVEDPTVYETLPPLRTWHEMPVSMHWSMYDCSTDVSQPFPNPAEIP
jgi:hypothetical protein